MNEHDEQTQECINVAVETDESTTTTSELNPEQRAADREAAKKIVEQDWTCKSGDYYNSLAKAAAINSDSTNDIKEKITLDTIKRFLKKKGQNIKNLNFTWVPISINEKRYVYGDGSPSHLLIIGTSRSGKTQQWIFPQIEIFASNKVYWNKRSMVISDPKGEIAQNTAQMCYDNGYDVKFLNVKIPPKGQGIEGVCFNPMEIVMDLYLAEIEPYIKHFDWEEIQNTSNDGNEKFILFVNQFEELKEEYKDTLPLNLVEMEVYMSVINSGIISIEGKDPYFEQTAQVYFTIFSSMLLDKSIANADVQKNAAGEWEFANYEFKKYYSIPNIITLFNEMIKQNDQKKTTFSLQISPKGELRVPASSPLAGFSYNESCCSTFTTKLKAFSYETIRRVTSKNDIDLFEIAKGEKPTIIYLITPDYDATFNSFITLFVSLFYFVLVKETEKHESGKLNRKVSFLLDEFGNIPAINQFATILTVCLGRGISFSMIVQNIQQIKEKYGEETKDTILDNSHLKLYLSAGEDATRDWFSKQLGSTTVLGKSHGNSSTDLSDRSVNWSEEEKRLVSADELGKNLLGKGYFTVLKSNPMESNFVPYYTYKKSDGITPGKFMENNGIIPSHIDLNLQDLMISDYKKDESGKNKLQLDLFFEKPKQKNQGYGERNGRYGSF